MRWKVSEAESESVSPKSSSLKQFDLTFLSSVLTLSEESSTSRNLEIVRRLESTRSVRPQDYTSYVTIRIIRPRLSPHIFGIQKFSSHPQNILDARYESSYILIANLEIYSEQIEADIVDRTSLRRVCRLLRSSLHGKKKKSSDIVRTYQDFLRPSITLF